MTVSPPRDAEERAARIRQSKIDYYERNKAELQARARERYRLSRVDNPARIPMTPEERKEAEREYQRRYKAKGGRPPQKRERKGEHFKRTFGITEDDYQRMLSEQNGVCALCLKEPGDIRLAVDHDHTTGVVRGLLCTGCNRLLGFIEARPGWMGRAEKYLQAISLGT